MFNIIIFVGDDQTYFIRHTFLKCIFRQKLGQKGAVLQINLSSEGFVSCKVRQGKYRVESLPHVPIGKLAGCL